MKCVNPIRLIFAGKTRKQQDLHSQYPLGLEVPCGKCLSCRTMKTKEWSLRMWHELESHDKSVFITLTYQDIHLPKNGTLVKEHLQLFLKRLRKAIHPRKIRYFACGEYGDTTQRPHYHLIVYGLGLDEIDKDHVKMAWPYADWRVYEIEKNAFGMVEPESIQYVAKYVNKQLNGQMEDAIYTQTGRINPFRLVSLGLGREYCDTHIDQIKQLGFVTKNGIKQSIPRYYMKRHRIDVEKTIERAKERDMEITEHYTKVSGITYDDAYSLLKPEDIKKMDEGIKQARRQREKTLETKVEMFKRKL